MADRYKTELIESPTGHLSMSVQLLDANGQPSKHTVWIDFTDDTDLQTSKHLRSLFGRFVEEVFVDEHAPDQTNLAST